MVCSVRPRYIVDTDALLLRASNQVKSRFMVGGVGNAILPNNPKFWKHQKDSSWRLESNKTGKQQVPWCLWQYFGLWKRF